MIIRIVTLQFQQDDIPAFRQIFAESKPTILAFDGCHRVDLLQSTEVPGMLLTYSHWATEDHLNAYRKSEFFGSVWPRTKSLLISKPSAISVFQISE